MRLINTSTLELHDFSLSIIPEYAILSHTWGDDEVTFQDMTSAHRTSKEGWYKITETCRKAREHSINFAWIDTCCIDKSSSAELTESINSMFQWYENARICYVFLEDISVRRATEQGMGGCRWFTRGWTLQELLASKKIQFFDRKWSYIGSTPELNAVITSYTDIPLEVLKKKNLSDWSVASKMSWAARRKTTRVEDEAYCLLGIFGVSLPLIYGEGNRAFRRLQEEIVKRSNDMTIFAWDNSPNHEKLVLDLFATSPAAFTSRSSWARPFFHHSPEFSVTNKGLLVSSHLPLRIRTATDDLEAPRYLLLLGSHKNYDQQIGIFLQKAAPSLFFRDGTVQPAWLENEDLGTWSNGDWPTYYILIDWTPGFVGRSLAFLDGAIHIPEHKNFTLGHMVPQALWDAKRRMLYKPDPAPWSRYNMVIAMLFTGHISGQDVQIVVLCDYRNGTSFPKCIIFESGNFSRETNGMLYGSSQNHSIYWVDLELQAPILCQLKDSLELKIENQVYYISATFEKESKEGPAIGAEMFSLNLKISKRRKKKL
jgi:Heterokaryon incompatibility protein (HET)